MEVGQNLVDLFAAQELSVWTRTQNRKAGNGVNDNTYFSCARASWRQHDAPPSTFASSGSPVRRPSLRRIGPGGRLDLFVETLVSMVRQSYSKSVSGSNLYICAATSGQPPNARL